MDNVSISENNSIFTISYLKDKRENQYFERKGLGEKQIKPSKIAEELIGMLNADGGSLFLGISDDGDFQDLSTSGLDLDKYRTLIFDFIHPTPNVILEEITVNNCLIFAYHVESDFERVFCRKDNEQVYLRVHDTNRLIDRDGVRKLEYDKQIRLFEEEQVPDFDTQDLDLALLDEYRQKVNYVGDALDLLCKRHIAVKKDGKYLFKKAAVLLFSNDPEKYIPSASVRYVRYEGTEAKTGVEHNVVKDERFERNIPKLIDNLRLFLNTSFKDYYFLDIDMGKFKKVNEYPEEAWLEGVVNALCHRSYNVRGNAIMIKHFDDRLEISNSGPLPAQVTIENIKDERYARNPRLARILEDLGYVRQLNEGVSRIYESMEKSMLSIPEYKVANGNVYLTLRNQISTHSKSIDAFIMERVESSWGDYNDTQKRILQFLFVQHQGTVDLFSTYTSVNVRTVRRYLNAFIEDNIVEKLGDKIRDKNAIYVYKKNANSI